MTSPIGDACHAAYDYDLFVIGGGSGGVRAARRAAALGKRVAIAEEYRFGGTCVIRGCVPKKLLVYASQFPEALRGCGRLRLDESARRSFDWPTLIANKDREIDRLEGVYRGDVEKAGGRRSSTTRAVLGRPHVSGLSTTGETVTAETHPDRDRRPTQPAAGLPGHEHCITSNEAFHLERLPKSIVIVGGGYIAVEFANIFHGLGVETTLVYRGQRDPASVSTRPAPRLCTRRCEQKGIRVLCRDSVRAVGRDADGRLGAHLPSGESWSPTRSCWRWAASRTRRASGCEAAGVELDKTRRDRRRRVFAEPASDNIWAIGDVTDRVQLTPVAIHEAMCFVETVFRGSPTKPGPRTVPTAVFSQPEIGTVGLTEEGAAKAYAEIEIYRAKFRPMKATLSGRDGTDDDEAGGRCRQRSSRRRACARAGCRRNGAAAGHPGESRRDQGDFDRTMAVHPTAAEELVTMYQPSYTIKRGVRS